MSSLFMCQYSILHFSSKVFTYSTALHLVLKSMLVYVEVLMMSQPTMMALAAEGSSLTCTHHLKSHPLIPENTGELEDSFATTLFDHLLMHYNCYKCNSHTKSNAQQQFMQQTLW